jgi:hypothetical protein
MADLKLVHQAKAEIAEWVLANVPDAEQRRALSKLVAAYVAAAVREDRGLRQVMADTRGLAELMREGKWP